MKIRWKLEQVKKNESHPGKCMQNRKLNNVESTFWFLDFTYTVFDHLLPFLYRKNKINIYLQNLFIYSAKAFTCKGKSKLFAMQHCNNLWSSLNNKSHDRTLQKTRFYMVNFELKSLWNILTNLASLYTAFTHFLLMFCRYNAN